MMMPIPDRRPDEPPLRVVIADDSVLLLKGVAHLLEDAGIQVCGEAQDAAELLQMVEIERPDVAIIDIRMPPTHTDEGLVAARQIRARFRSTAVLVFSMYTELSYATQLIEENSGGCGYLLKERVMDVGSLVNAINRVRAGEIVVDRELIDAVLRGKRKTDKLADLTDREREVLALMAEGLTDRGIAELLWVTADTVETHVRHILRKLGLPASYKANRRVHAVLAYLRDSG